MLHICFSDSEYCIIKHVMELGLIENKTVVLFNDDLSVGDISNCRDYEKRKKVLHNIFLNDIHNISDNELKIEYEKFYETLSKENDFIIWYAFNPRDYCNLYYIVNLFSEKNIKVVECIKKTIGNNSFHYKWVGEILPEDMPMFFNRARTLNKQEKNKYSSKWKKLSLENGLLRANICGEIKTVNENYYDNLVLKNISMKNKMIVSIIGKLMGINELSLREWFFIWRIKCLVDMNYVKVDYKFDKYMLNSIQKLP